MSNLSKSIFITGSSGFLGSNVISFFESEENIIFKYLRGTEIDLKSANSVIHLAGLSSDGNNSISYSDFYQSNFELTKQLFDQFLISNSNVFIFLSSVKAISDSYIGELTEAVSPHPKSFYGRSKLLAEQYILSKNIPYGKRIYVLRPCIIHGPGNNGNLNLLFKLVTKNLPWPLGAFENKRSFCSIDNLMFIIKELIEREDISSGIYNIADDEPLSTNELIWLIAQSQNRNARVWDLPINFIKGIAFLGDKLHLPLNTVRLQKLTSSFVVSNAKIKAAIGKALPISSRDGLLKTFKSFNS